MHVLDGQISRFIAQFFLIFFYSNSVQNRSNNQWQWFWRCTFYMNITLAFLKLIVADQLVVLRDTLLFVIERYNGVCIYCSSVIYLSIQSSFFRPLKVVYRWVFKCVLLVVYWPVYRSLYKVFMGLFFGPLYCDS